MHLQYQGRPRLPQYVGANWRGWPWRGIMEVARKLGISEQEMI